MNWEHVRHKFQVIDPRGLEPDTLRSLRLIIVAVMGGIVWTNITTGIAFTGYWKEMGASDLLYGVMLSLPPIANAFQFIASYVLEKRLKRKRMFLIAGFIQRLVWIPFAIVPLVIPVSAASLRIWTAAILVLASAGMAPFMNVAFYSICDDVIPIRIRGRYLASRSRISTIVGLTMGIVIGIILDSFSGMTGYAIAFIIAGVLGTGDIVCFIFMKLPEMRPAKQRSGMFTMLKHVFADKKYMRIVYFCTAWLFAINLASPYFNVYMKGFMGMSNTQITIFNQVINNVSLVLVVSAWGNSLDRYGSKPVLFMACTLTGIMPILWLFIGKGDLLLVIISAVLAGTSWCAYELGSQTLFMGQAHSESKSMYFAVFFMLTQLFGVAGGNTVGGLLLDDVFSRAESWGIVIFGSELTRYNYLFFVSGILRLSSMFILLPRVTEDGAKSVREMLSVLPARYYMLKAAIMNTKPARKIARRRLGKM